MKKAAHFLLFVLTIATLLLSACGGVAATPTASVGGGRPEPIPVAFIGMVDSIAGDQWVINGNTVTVSPDVIRDGPFQAGDQVKVEGVVNSDGSFTVSRLEIPSPEDLSALPTFGGLDNSNSSNTNDSNSNDANSNDDNSNDSNANDANTNDDNGNGTNTNDDNSNDVNSNDDNGNDTNDDNGNDANSNDDNRNGDNSNDSNTNDDNSNSGGGNDNGGGEDEDGNGSNDNGGEDENSND